MFNFTKCVLNSCSLTYAIQCYLFLLICTANTVCYFVNKLISYVTCENKAALIWAGHAKLRGRVLRRRGCVNTVRWQHGCYAMKQHCLFMCESVRKWVESFGCPFKQLALFVRTHFQAYPCRFVCKTALKISKHCHWLCNSLVATPGRTLRLRRCS